MVVISFRTYEVMRIGHFLTVGILNNGTDFDASEMLEVLDKLKKSIPSYRRKQQLDGYIKKITVGFKLGGKKKQ